MPPPFIKPGLRLVGRGLLAYVKAASARTRQQRLDEIRREEFPRRVLTGVLSLRIAEGAEVAIRAWIDGGPSGTNQNGVTQLHLKEAAENTTVVQLELMRAGRPVASGRIRLKELRLRNSDGPATIPIRTESATWQVEVAFAPARGDATGLTYDPAFPVLDERIVPYPKVVEPLPSHLEMTKAEVRSMQALGGALLVLGDRWGAEFLPSTWLRDRVADPESAEYWAERRMNGFNPGHLKRVEGMPWQYEISLNCNYERLPGFELPMLGEARFTLHGETLRAHSVRLTYSDGRAVETPWGRNAEWRKARAIYELVEVNFHSNAMHVGVHFDVEQYAMAAYRNLFRNPVLALLEPHFADTSYTSREVVWPRDAGVVSLAYQLTTAGQAQQVRDYLATLSFKRPLERLPDNIRNNYFDTAQAAMWELLGVYVDRFFARNEERIRRHWDEIEGMSRDLAAHAPQRTDMTIASMEDLRTLCRYVILRATFHHSWIHFKDREDAQTFDGMEFSPDLPAKERKSRLHKARVVQFFVHYLSWYKRQFEIVDEAAALPELAALLREYAPRIDPGFDTRRITSTPNS